MPAALFIAVSAALAPQAQAPPASSPPPPDRPITRIVQNLGEDFKRMASVETLIILTAGGAASLITANSDESLDRWAVNHPAGSWTSIGRVAGDGWTMGGVALGTWAAGELTNHRMVTHIGSDLIRTQVMNGVLSRTIKIAADRSRPSGGGHSFPSGHASASFAMAGVLHEHFGWKAAGPGYAAATFIAWTRIRDRAHWLSDLTFGAALGLASARAVTRDHSSRTWSIAPMALPGGGGIVFVRR